MSPSRPAVNRTWVAFVVIVVLLISAAGLTIENTRRLRSQSELVVHTNEVVRQLETISLTAAQELIEVRRMLASGQPAVAIESLELGRQVDDLAQLVSDNAIQVESIGKLRLRSTEFQQKLAGLLGVSTSTLSEFGDAMRSADSAFRMLRDTCVGMRQYEMQLLKDRSLNSDRLFRSTLASQIASSIVGIICCYAALALTRRMYRRELEFAEDQLRLEERTTFLVNSSGDGICGLDPRGTCTIINDAGAKMLGYSANELVGRPLFEIIHVPANETSPNATLAQVTSTAAGVSRSDQLRVKDGLFRHRDGTLIDVAYTTSPWKQHGNTLGSVISFSDIRERKRAERQIILAQKEAEQARQIAEDANKAKSNFLANMSHELRTPLNAVIMYSEMLQEDASDMQLTDFAKDLSRIHVAGRHLLALVNGVLDLAKIEAGKMEVFLENASIEATVDDVVNTVRNLVEKNKNKFLVELNVRGRMQTDVTKFRQILLNLLSNAAKFTSNGQVSLVIRSEHAAGPLDIGGVEGGSVEREFLVLTISDNGVGIPKEKMDALFTPFVQAEKSTSKDYGGTGLGLALVKQFVDLLGGRVEASSDVGAGSTFIVRLPRNSVEQGVAHEKPQPTVEADVVIIDDDEHVREFVARALRADGIKTAVASDGESGFHLVTQLLPKLVVLDVLMPKMDGWTVLSKLKADNTTANIPVVLLTIAGQADLGYSLGAQEYLMKPVGKEDLLAVARRLGVTNKTPTLLVIDDDPGTQELVSRILAKEGWRLRFAENGEVALNALKSDVQPDMILLDLQMPVMDGFDFLEALRAGAATTDAPIVVLTSLDLNSSEKAWLSERVSTILEKGGQSPASLLEVLRASIKQRLTPTPVDTSIELS